jgi:hypothetical protein
MDYNNWYPSLQTPTIQVPPISSYAPKYGADTQAGQMIGQIGQYLKPYTPFTGQLPYEQYAAPTRESFNAYERTMLRPYFDRFTMNPWQRSYANNAAASGSFMMGNARKQYGNAKTQVMEPYQNQIRQSRDALEDMITKGWQSQLEKAGSSPTTMTNIANTLAPTTENRLAPNFNIRPTF